MNTTMRSIGRAAIAVILFSAFTASAALINQWAFDGDFTDSVGSDNGTGIGSTAADGTAKIGTASLNIDTSLSEKVQVADSATLDLDGSFTLSTWIDPDTLANAYNAMMIKGSFGGSAENYFFL